MLHQDQIKKGSEAQHPGIGKNLMFLAESEAWKTGYRRVAIIAGIGVRGYYAKLGYQLQDTYMVKELTQAPRPYVKEVGSVAWSSFGLAFAIGVGIILMAVLIQTILANI